MAGWPGGRVAGWPGGRVAGWPGGRGFRNKVSPELFLFFKPQILMLFEINSHVNEQNKASKDFVSYLFHGLKP